jgi:peptidoglycan/xylan/chitin deacetylase (PgdA/CDA1 family)
MARMATWVPARLGLTRAWRRVDRSSVPVILLHGVLPDADTSPFNASGKFIDPRRMGAYLERIGRIFRVMSAEDLLHDFAAGKRPANAMVLTFDDGYANNCLHALPLLTRMGLPFTVFVTTGFLDSPAVLWNDLLEFAISSTREQRLPAGVLADDRPLGTAAERRAAIAALKDVLKRNPRDQAARQVDHLCEVLGTDRTSPKLADVRFMTSDDIRRLAGAGVGIGGHGVTHAVLSRESPQRAKAEVVDCKARLEGLVGRPVTLFAYPNGRPEDFNQAVKRDLAEAGYKAAFTTVHGLHRPGEDIFEIRRISLDNRWSYEEFETRASGILKALQC